MGWWDEITQGALGDCYLIASLSAVATKPQDIKDVFIQSERTPAGIYTVRFFIRGKPHLITIDDELLYNNDQDELFFGNPNQYHPSLWGPLLEKAWAKVDMNYENAEGGWQHHVLRTLLGCPVFAYRMSRIQRTAKEMFNLIRVQQQRYDYPYSIATDSKHADGSD